MMEFLQSVYGVYGIGAVFAIILFLVLIKVIKLMREDRKYMEDRLTSVIDAYNAATRENSRINGELYAYLKAKNGNKT